jgi:hypothetical protein
MTAIIRDAGTGERDVHRQICNNDNKKKSKGETRVDDRRRLPPHYCFSPPPWPTDTRLVRERRGDLPGTALENSNVHARAPLFSAEEYSGTVLYVV